MSMATWHPLLGLCRKSPAQTQKMLWEHPSLNPVLGGADAETWLEGLPLLAAWGLQ